MEIMRRVGKSKPTVWRWQQRYVAAGVDGLSRDRPRGPGKPALGGEVISLVLTKTLGDKPPKATHWSLRTMAKAVGIGPSSVQRIWAKHGLKPHLVSTFKVSNDPKLAEKVADVIGLYMNPPDKALVYSMDEKSQIQPHILTAAAAATRQELLAELDRCRALTTPGERRLAEDLVRQDRDRR